MNAKSKIVTGWEGQFKGLLQVLCERGLIKTKVLDKYTLDGQKDTITGKVDYCIHFATCLLNVVQTLSMRKRHCNIWEHNLV